MTGYYDRNMSRINKKINEEIKQDKKKSRNRHKILLLGCGEAGKVNKFCLGLLIKAPKWSIFFSPRL